ncbi:hypothetical protein [Candidatus Poriferisodalis sp.]|uniref:hypothetical protein n=1 Tax=Candidatus Poriferisodalis sp. TaxID=3101277 RepID=UPI003B5175B7
MDDPEKLIRNVIHDDQFDERTIALRSDDEDAPVVCEVDLARVANGVQDVGVGDAMAAC